jgi:hypothetical protein
MQNRVKDHILSLVSTGTDTVGWLTVITLIFELTVLKSSDHVLVLTMAPVIVLMVTYNMLDLLMPHRCTDECNNFCPGGDEYDPNEEMPRGAER